MRNRLGTALIFGLFVVTLLLVGLVSSNAVHAQETVTDDDVNAVSEKLYCPVCENIPLEDCGTAACIQWREEIRDQLEAGRTEDQVIADFVNRFGQQVIGTPQDPFLRALSLATPFIVGGIALIVALWTFFRWRNEAGSRPARAGGLSPDLNLNAPSTRSDVDYRAQIERDVLAKR